MKKTCILLISLIMVSILIAETNPVSEYVNSPSISTYISAVQYCNASLEKDPSQNNQKVLLANLAVMEANRLVDEISPVKDSLDAGGKFQFANLMLAIKNYPEAIGIYQQINTDVPAWSCPWRHKGEAYYRMGNFKDASIAFEHAIETNKEHYDAYIWLAKAQYELKKYKAALQNLEIALTLNPEAEESPDEAISEDSIKALHETLLKKAGKRK